MNRVTTIAFHLLVASLVFWSCLGTGTRAQTPSSSPPSTKAPETKPAPVQEPIHLLLNRRRRYRLE